MKRYAYRDWESVLASLGHGALKEGQIINRMLSEKERSEKKIITDENILDSIANVARLEQGKKEKNGIIVKGMHDLAVRFSRCCSPVPGDEIVGFVTRGRGISLHRTDCINVLNMPEEERVRLVPAQWEMSEAESGNSKYQAEIKIYAHNRIGIFVDISKVFTEKNLDITSMNSRANKQGLATINISFDIKGTEELNTLISRLRQIDSVIDIERTTG